MPSTHLSSPTPALFTIVNDPPLCHDEVNGAYVVYGLAGDPPHLGHRRAIRWLAERSSHVFVALSAAHAFGKATAPYERRRTWLQQLLSDLPTNLHARVSISDVEGELQRRNPTEKVYSIDVMHRLQAQHPHPSWAWGFGPDNATPAMLQRFHRWEALTQWPVWCIPTLSAWRSTDMRKSLETNNTVSLIEGMGPDLAQEVQSWAQTPEGLEWLNARHASASA